MKSSNFFLQNDEELHDFCQSPQKFQISRNKRPLSLTINFRFAKTKTQTTHSLQTTPLRPVCAPKSHKTELIFSSNPPRPYHRTSHRRPNCHYNYIEMVWQNKGCSRDDRDLNHPFSNWLDGLHISARHQNFSRIGSGQQKQQYRRRKNSITGVPWSNITKLHEEKGQVQNMRGSP